MPATFRPALEAPPHRQVETNERRPYLCLTVSAIFCLLMIFVFGICAWNVYTHRFDWNHQTFSEGDQVAVSAISNDFSYQFCDGYTVEISDGAVYLLPHHAKVTTTNRTVSGINMRQLPNHPPNVDMFYLLHDSVIDVQGCRQRDSPDIEAEIILFQGKSNLKWWRRDKFCDGCILKSVNIPRFSNSSSNLERPHACARLKQTITENDVYFLLILYGTAAEFSEIYDVKRHHDKEDIRLRGKLERTHFDLSHAQETCTKPRPRPVTDDGIKVTCNFDLPWQSPEDIVVSFYERREDDPPPPSPDHISRKRGLHTKCQPRIIIWILLFLIFPMILCACFSAFVGFCLCRKRPLSYEAMVIRVEKQRKRCRRRNREERLVETRVVALDYGSVKIQE